MINIFQTIFGTKNDREVKTKPKPIDETVPARRALEVIFISTADRRLRIKAIARNAKRMTALTVATILIARMRRREIGSENRTSAVPLSSS